MNLDFRPLLFAVLLAFLMAACSSNQEAVPETTDSTVISPVSTPVASSTVTLPVSTSTPTASPTATYIPIPNLTVNPRIDLSQSHESEDGRLTVQYPEGWTYSGFRLPNETVNNGIIRLDGSEVSLQIIEPIYVIELLGVEDTSKMSMESLLAASANLDSELVPYIESSAIYSLEGREVGITRVRTSDKDLDSYIIRNTDGFVTILNATAPVGQLQSVEAETIAIASSLEYKAPNQTLQPNDPSAFVFNYISALDEGDTDEAQSMFCATDQLYGSFFKYLAEDTGTPEIVDAIEELASDVQEYNFDYSHLFYQTVLTQENAAIVRVSGNVFISDGQKTTAIPFRYVQPFNVDFFPLNRSGNGWTICVLGTNIEEPTPTDAVETKLYWQNGTTISRINLNGTQVEDIVERADVEHFTVDPARNHLIWVTGNDGIYISNLLGENREFTFCSYAFEECKAPLGSDPLAAVGPIFVDSETGTIYWVSFLENAMVAGSPDGTFANVIFDMNTAPSCVAFDDTNNKFYWISTDIWPNYSFYRANSDGTALEKLSVVLDPLPSSIYLNYCTFDSQNQMLYLSDRQQGIIFRVDINTMASEQFVTGLDAPQGIVVDTNNQYLYFTDGTAIYRIGLDGTQKIKIYEEPFARLGDLALSPLIP